MATAGFHVDNHTALDFAVAHFLENGVGFVQLAQHWGSDIFCIGRPERKKWPQSFNDGDYGHFLIRNRGALFFQKLGKNGQNFGAEWSGNG